MTTERAAPFTEHDQLLVSPQDVLDALDSHIAIVDGSGEIVAVNDAWRRFGRDNGLRDRRAAVGANYLRICDRVSGDEAEFARAAADGIRSVIRGDRDRYELEYPCHSPGEKRWFVLRVTPVADRRERPVVVAHDNVTARHEAETAARRLYESERAAREAADDAVESRRFFLEAVTHDVRNVLSVISARIELLRRKHEGEDVQTDLRRLERLTRRLDGEITQLNDVALLEVGQPLPIVEEPVDLVQLLRELLDDEAELTRIAFETDVESAIVTGDRVRLTRAFGNLLNNALKYGGGAPIRVQLQAGPAEYAVSIVDQGPGIAHEELPRIFDRFFRGSAERATSSGSGIGLAAARAIAERHGGTILAASSVGAGSTFTIRLPRA